MRAAFQDDAEIKFQETAVDLPLNGLSILGSEGSTNQLIHDERGIIPLAE